MTQYGRAARPSLPAPALPSQFADDLPTIEKRLCKCLILYVFFGARGGIRTRKRLSPRRILRFPGGFPSARTISSPQRGAGRSSAGIIVGAHPASLCTFRGTSALRGLAQDYPGRDLPAVGFPEFTRFLTRALPRGRPFLESPVSASSTTRAHGTL